MATLILTAVGTAVGGPVGGAIGAILGQQIDGQLFAPKPRHGPRLGDLAVQTSTYGTTIPKIFGTMRVAGCVIWATDLREERATNGGKGQPDTVSYSYSANFAVALSGRPIRGVRRIWADGKLLRGAAGDFKTPSLYRLYLGEEDQPVDPLIASTEGAGQSPAYRGLAYAVFESFQLAEYGNRIPSLSFEVEAEAGPVAIGAIAEELSGGAVKGGGAVTLGGYAAGGDSVRGAIEALSDVVPLSLVEDFGALRLLSEPEGQPVQIGSESLGAVTEGAGGRTEMQRQAAGSLPAEVTLAYYDVERDYQTGLQRAVRGGPSIRSDRRALPATLAAGEAKALAEHRLAALWAGRATGKLHLGWRRSAIRPGTAIRLEGEPGLWKVSRWTLDHMVVSLDLVRLRAETGLPQLASAGRPVVEADRVQGATRALLLDLPLATEPPPTRPLLFVAAAGEEVGWRHANLLASYDGGASWETAGRTSGVAVIGTALNSLSEAGSALLDERNVLEVELLNEDMWIESRDEAALAAGANLALIGDELIQFLEAQPIGPQRFRLRRLLRGRRGTEWAAAIHAPGDAFLLIQNTTLAGIKAPEGALGGEMRLLVHGQGDGIAGVTITRSITGETLRPPSPVHLRAETGDAGDIEIRWVRRSRLGWTWPSGGDTPLGEESERYRLTLSSTGFHRVLTLEEPFFLYTAAAQAADGVSGALTIRIAQLGTFAASREAQTISAEGENR